MTPTPPVPSTHPLRSLAPRPTVMPGAAGGEAPRMAVLLRAVRKNWFLLVFAMGAALTGAALYTARETRIFEAAAVVQLDPQPLMPLGNQVGQQTGPESFWSNQEYFATQHQILASRKIAAAVVRRLGLNRDGGFAAGAPPGAKVPSVDLSVDDTAEMLRRRLDVKAVLDSRLTRVAYRDADPARAQRRGRGR
jgi:uncharacterized protein involved in exopolysaccharide biosynthesis